MEKYMEKYIPVTIKPNCSEPVKIIMLLTLYSCLLYCFISWYNKNSIGLGTSIIVAIFIFGTIATYLVCNNFNETAAYAFIFIMASVYIFCLAWNLY